MTKQELQQIIEDLNQLVNNTKGNYVNEDDVLEAIHNDGLKKTMLDSLVRNNTPYTLCCVSVEITRLAYRIYLLGDYVDSEEKYLNKTLRALDGFKSELQRIQEYIDSLKHANALDASMGRYRETVLEGVRMYDYKCSSNNITY